MKYKVELIKELPLEKYSCIIEAVDIEQVKSICSNDLYFDYFGDIRELKEDLDSDYRIVKYDDEGIKQYELYVYEDNIPEMIKEVASSSFRGETIDIEYKRKKKWKVVFSKLLF